MRTLEAAVVAVAEAMASAGTPTYQGWIADPRAVWEGVRAQHPEVAKAIVRYYPNPVAQVGAWVPRAGR